MSKLIKIALIFVLFVLGGSVHGNAQDPLPQCLVFERGAEFINIRMSEDSTRASISIIRKGFETEEQRKKAREEYHRQVDPYQPPPSFTINFISSRKPEKVMSIKEIDNNCVRLVNVDEFRKEKLGGSVVTFIKQLSDGTFLKWIAVLMAEE